MTVLRMTRPDAARQQSAPVKGLWFLSPQVLAVWIGVALVGVTGCGVERPDSGTSAAPTSEQTSYNPPLSSLPPPATDRIVYKDRTLTLYDLPGSGRWMIQRPDVRFPYPVGPEHTLPEGVDAGKTFVYYRVSSGLQSPFVSLAEIQAAGRDHDSQIR